MEMKVKIDVIVADPVIFVRFDRCPISNENGLIVNGEPIKNSFFANRYNDKWYTAKFSGDHKEPVKSVEFLNSKKIKSVVYESEVKIEGLKQSYSAEEWNRLFPDADCDEYPAKFFTCKIEYFEPCLDKIDIAEVSIICRVDGYKFPISFGKYVKEATPISFNDATNYVINAEHICHDKIDTIMIPSPLLHNCRAVLRSVDLFKIIKDYVKENIDPEVARVISDYDFHFEVAKITKLHKPRIEMTIGSLFSKKKRKPTYVEVKEVCTTCFNICPEENKWKDSHILPPLEANSEQELYDKLEMMLQKLIKFINSPIHQCEHCNGSGLVPEDVKTIKEIMEG